ncbi:hypothetical protein THMIRHAM_00360 [Thiomicrorhabdus immobilis]|uniref:7 transmembrane helices usually fused to an inactive transglutaminase domain-containing protein n=1 Tax=Thiomicrorhabdus immobilis TaxID=2791037 RepID=A0ABM7MAA2_9GAMM|nr:7TM domain-containing protein [Thiomicrorhabdus immobilis]BCN92251.1 hypothetical protein THMIRHAM_00360 [Thiomicrorhabdus immobilis]
MLIPANKKVILSLIGLAVFIFILKQFWLPVSDTNPSLHSKLTLQYEVTKTILDKTEIQLPLPYSTRENRLISQSMSYNGWRISKRNYKVGEKRGLVLIASDKKPSIIRLEYNFSHDKKDKKRVANPLNPDDYQKYTALEDSQKGRFAKFQDFLIENGVVIDSITQSAEHLQNYLALYEKYWGKFPTYKKIRNTTCNNWLTQQQNLLASLKSLNIPARTVCGIGVDYENKTYKRGWLEFHNGTYWQTLDLWAENTLTLIALSKDSNDFSSLKNGTELKEIIQIDSFQFNENTPFNYEEFYNLKLLPLELQDALKILLTLPFALLITAFLKALFKIETHGILTPALLGLALAFNEIVLSLIIMALVFVPTIFIRKLVANKNKIVEHTVTLTFVILILILIITVSDIMNWLDNPIDALLPVIILTLLVDKYFVSLDKNGTHHANMKLLYTLMLTFIVIGILQLSFIGDWLLIHPEAHLITIALALFLYQPKEIKTEIESKNTEDEINPRP